MSAQPYFQSESEYPLTRQGMPCSVRNVLDACSCGHARYQHNADGRCRAHRGRCGCRSFDVQQHASLPVPAERIDLDRYVREFLDGVVGDADPAAYETQESAIAALETALVDRFGRELTMSECAKIGLALAREWNSRLERRAAS